MLSSSVKLTREELYALVWEKAVMHVAKSFGLSDVGLRKICVKHDIPTPPMGYWAKLAHGKAVKKTPLPPLKAGNSNWIYIHEGMPHMKAVSAAVARAAEDGAMTSVIMVPSGKPEHLLPILMAAEKALKKSKPDREGFVSCEGSGLPCIRVGPNSIERALSILDAFLKAAVNQGGGVNDKDKNLSLVIDEEAFTLRFYEAKDKRSYRPTRDDLKQQARYDENSRRIPSLYPPGRIVYPTWEYYPSGRLAIEITDPT
jgi:hypothetical protein